MRTNSIRGLVDRPQRVGAARWGMAVLGVGLWLATTVATRAAEPPPWRYVLLPASRLIDDCPICDRLPTVVPLRGTFRLRPAMTVPPGREDWMVENLVATAGDSYSLQGDGVYSASTGGLQWMRLKLKVQDGKVTEDVEAEAQAVPITRPWPILELTVDQTNGNDQRVYHLQIVAAPIQDLWFSTETGFTSGSPPTPVHEYVSEGALLAEAGRVVRWNSELTRQLGFLPPVPDLGLDAVDVAPGGEVWFSTTQSQWSEGLDRWIGPGDLVSDAGRVVKTNGDLLAGFLGAGQTLDAGLDAVQLQPDGAIWFSVRQGFKSETLGQTIGRGDLLSDRGVVVRTNKELLSRFHPLEPSKDYGLDALYVWPGGEIWFSVEEGFVDLVLGPVGRGDLLSDQGSVVYGNLELVRRFQPLEDLADFGLDALFVVTDAAPWPAAPAVIKRLEPVPLNGGRRLEWLGPGRVFQVERAPDAEGPYLPLGWIQTQFWFEDGDPASPVHPWFYRVRQW